jgi:hypothetical protein
MDQAQFADQLLGLERLFYTKLALWAGLSLVTGSLAFAVIQAKRLASPLLEQFAIQSMLWGVVELGVAVWGRRGVAMRDLAGAVGLDRGIWFGIGLAVGAVLLGVALSITGWRLGRRLGLVGAGVAIVVQGLVLALLHLQLSASILR